jgi:hypothetical protein
MLTGDSGAYVLSYSLHYAGLSSDAVDGHIHYSTNPPGREPVDQTGPSGEAESRNRLVQGPVDLGPQIIFRDPAPIKEPGCPVVSLSRVDLHHERP